MDLDVKDFVPHHAEGRLTNSGLCIIPDLAIGLIVMRWRERHMRLKGFDGIHFILLQTWYRESIRLMLRHILESPQLGLIRVLKGNFPPHCAYRFQNGSEGKTPPAVMVQLWGPDTKVIYYHNTRERQFEETDQEVADTWRLLNAPREALREQGAREELLEMAQGATVFVDSRMFFTVVQGYIINVGFYRPEDDSSSVELPHSDNMQTVIDKMQEGGLGAKYTWETIGPHERPMHYIDWSQMFASEHLGNPSKSQTTSA